MTPSISTYTTAWGLGGSAGKSFDPKGALANWAFYANDISVAIPEGDETTVSIFEAAAAELGVSNLLSIVRTPFDFKSDSFAYGKTENAALQNCKGNVLVQQNLDERLAGDKQMVLDLGEHLYRQPMFSAYYAPVINLYGDLGRYLDIAGKWRIHRKGLYRGAFKGGIKPDGKPDYDKTSTDELIDKDGNLVRWYSLLQPKLGGQPTIDDIKTYIDTKLPLTYHLGFLNLADRLDRSIWWKRFWEKATNGDPNQHPETIEELANRETKEHGLPQPLWPTVQTGNGGVSP